MTVSSGCELQNITFMKSLQKWLTFALVSALCFGFSSCSDKGEDGPVDDGIKVELTLPKIIQVKKGEPVTVDMKAGSVIYSSDIIQLQASNGTLINCTISAVGETSVTFLIPETTPAGSYTAFVKRGQERRQQGQFTLVYIEDDPEGWDLADGTTVYGKISSVEGPVANVVVSDGIDFAVTNEKGQYELKSKKALGYVFMSVPSGYDPVTNGVMPVNYKLLTSSGTTPERVDFSLNKVDQSNYRVLFFGDMHLANRNDDIKQFGEMVKDINTHGIKGKTYAITLGDMTWDLYWYDQNFQFSNYIDLMNRSFKNLITYNTIGNHDNDYKATNNAAAKRPFVHSVAPSYYSFNIGQVHYVVLDDIDCSTYDGTTSRNYTEKIYQPQMQWLRKDLSYVDKSTPIVLTMHAPAFGPSTATQFKYSMEGVSDLLSALKDFNEVHLVTGHTHKNAVATSAASILNAYPNIIEHNQGAVCGDWWWSGHLTPGALTAHDGTPAGYGIWDFQGKNIRWKYKGTNLDENIQFRTYDLNNVSFSLADVPNLTNTSVQNSFKKYIDAYPVRHDNKVLINMWNYDPKWTITVTDEGGNKLPVTPRMAYDPLHIKAMSIKRFNRDISSVPNFITGNWTHFFEVTAPDANTDLTITATDRFGNTYTEKMERPKKFDLPSYVW